MSITKLIKFFWILALSFLSFGAFAQNQSPEEEEKQLRKAIDAQIENYTDLLKLEDWQIFYLDSILTNDFSAMMAELKELSQAKVSNQDAYMIVQDKWSEQIYNSLKGVFDENQWAKYEKSGAARDKKARDKRAAKRK